MEKMIKRIKGKWGFRWLKEVGDREREKYEDDR